MAPLLVFRFYPYNNCLSTRLLEKKSPIRSNFNKSPSITQLSMRSEIIYSSLTLLIQIMKILMIIFIKTIQSSRNLALKQQKSFFNCVQLSRYTRANSFTVQTITRIKFSSSCMVD